MPRTAKEKVRTVTVRATKPGFYGTQRRYEGNVFDVTLVGDQKVASWMEEFTPPKVEETEKEEGAE